MELPIHPALVHFPIALYFFELLLLSFWAFKKDGHYLRAALFTFRAAFFMMIAALASGWKEVGGWQHVTGEVAEHFWGAVSVGVIQLARGIYWHRGKLENKKAMILILSALAGCAAVLYTAYHGGELVYGEHAH